MFKHVCWPDTTEADVSSILFDTEPTRQLRATDRAFYIDPKLVAEGNPSSALGSSLVGAVPRRGRKAMRLAAGRHWSRSSQGIGEAVALRLARRATWSFTTEVTQRSQAWLSESQSSAADCSIQAT